MQHRCSSVARLLFSPVPIVALSARWSDAARALYLVADPTTKNIQRQRNGFGTFRQAFQKSSTVGSKCVARTPDEACHASRLSLIHI